MDKIKLGSNRSFGILFFVLFLIIALYPLINNNDLRIWSLLISLVFLILGIINSRILTPLHILWIKFGIFLGKIVSPLIIGLIFFIIVTPIGFIMRAMGKDLLNLKFNKNKTYWIEKKVQKVK